MGGFFSFYYDFVWKTDNRSSCIGDCFLLHAQMIGTIRLNHVDFAVFDLTDIGISNGDDLIFCERVCAVFFSVYCDADACVIAVLHQKHTAPEGKCYKKDGDDKNKFFLFQAEILRVDKRSLTNPAAGTDIK